MSIVARWDLQSNLTDSVGGHTLIENGSVPFNSTPNSPVLPINAGTYSVVDYFNTPASFSTAVAGLSTYTVQGYVYLDSYTAGAQSGPILFVLDDLNPFQGVTLRFLDTGKIRIIVDNAAFADSPGVVQGVGVWTFFALTYDGSTVRAYASPASNISSFVAVSLSTANASIPTPAILRLGRWADGFVNFEFPVDGYFQQVSVSNTQEIIFPTIPLPTPGDSFVLLSVTETDAVFQWGGSADSFNIYRAEITDDDIGEFILIGSTTLNTFTDNAVNSLVAPETGKRYAYHLREFNA